MRVGRYFTAKEDGRIVIRRWMSDGKRPRYPMVKYSHLTTQAEIEALVIRLNHEDDQRAQEKIKIKTAFIHPELLETFRSILMAEIPSQKDARYLYNTVFHLYFLKFFVTTLNLPDPRQWSKHQEQWGLALMSKSDHSVFDQPAASKTIRACIQVGNRFLDFLHTKHPEEYGPIKLKPISKAALKEYEAKRTMFDEDIGQYVRDEDWAIIEPALPEAWGCYIRLMYSYGLRRSESLGFTTTDAIKHGHLLVSTQLESLKAGEKPVKDLDKRNTPHWFATPQQCFDLVQKSMEHKMHPDTLSQRWVEFRDKLKMTYDLHDFRRTFITKALRLQNARDVQLAVGHADLRTTMGYAQDDRTLNGETWKPAG